MISFSAFKYTNTIKILPIAEVCYLSNNPKHARTRTTRTHHAHTCTREHMHTQTHKTGVPARLAWWYWLFLGLQSPDWPLVSLHVSVWPALYAGKSPPESGACREKKKALPIMHQVHPQKPLQKIKTISA